MIPVERIEANRPNLVGAFMIRAAKCVSVDTARSLFAVNDRSDVADALKFLLVFFHRI
jgi:hypothetical protein